MGAAAAAAALYALTMPASQTTRPITSLQSMLQFHLHVIYHAAAAWDAVKYNALTTPASTVPTLNSNTGRVWCVLCWFHMYRND
jgi:hypothetical protein